MGATEIRQGLWRGCLIGEYILFTQRKRSDGSAACPAKLRGMSTITFDTLKFADTLKAAGVPDKQAEAEARALADAFSSSTSELSTKADIRDLRNEMELMRRDMQAMEQRLTIKLGAFMAIAVGSIAALVKLA